MIRGRGAEGGLKEKGLIYFLPLEREHLVQRGGLFERGGGGGGRS